MHTLDSDHLARLALDRLVHLSQARDADRVRVERREEVGHRGARLGEEEGLQFLEWGRETLVLEGAHRFGPRGGNQLDRREVLAELGVCPTRDQFHFSGLRESPSAAPCPP